MKVEQLCWLNFLASVLTCAIQDRLVQDWLEQNLRQWCTGHTWKQFHGTATFVDKWENHFVVGREMQYPMKRRGFWMMVYHAIGWNHLRAKCWGYFFGLLWSLRWKSIEMIQVRLVFNHQLRHQHWLRLKRCEMKGIFFRTSFPQTFQRLGDSFPHPAFTETFWYLWFEEIIIIISNDLLLVVE